MAKQYWTKDGELLVIGGKYPHTITFRNREYNPKSERPIFYLMKIGASSAVEAMLEAEPHLRETASDSGYSLDGYNELYGCGMQDLLKSYGSEVASPIIEYCKAALFSSHSREEVEVAGSVDKTCDAASPADDLYDH